MTPTSELTDSAIAGIASKTTFWASILSFCSWLKDLDVGVWAGILIGLAGFAINFYFRRKEYQLKLRADQREQQEHEARMAQLRNPPPIFFEREYADE